MNDIILMMELMKDLGCRNHSELSEKLGIPKSTLSVVMKGGKIGPSTHKKIEEYLGESIYDRYRNNKHLDDSFRTVIKILMNDGHIIPDAYFVDEYARSVLIDYAKKVSIEIENEKKSKI